MKLFASKAFSHTPLFSQIQDLPDLKQSGFLWISELLAPAKAKLRRFFKNKLKNKELIVPQKWLLNF